MVNWNPQWGNEGDLGSHKGHLHKPDDIVNVKSVKLGRIVSFSYTTQGETREKARLVFVLHPNFEDKCHALTLSKIDRETLLKEIYPKLKEGLDNPIDFYHQYYKTSAISKSDSYRTYDVNKMQNIVQFAYGASTEQKYLFEENEYGLDFADEQTLFKLFSEGAFGKIKDFYNRFISRKKK